MKKTAVKKVKEKTIGDYAVEIAKQRQTDVIKDESTNKSLKPPRWVKPENHRAYMEMVHQLVLAEFNNISEFARKYNLNRSTIYAWLKSQDTKDLVDEVIKTLAVADKAKVYQMVLSQVPNNPGFARLWMERYEGYRPDQPKSGNITINFNFLDPPKIPAKEAEDAEYTEE